MAKSKRTHNTNLIKGTVSYSIFEIAELFGIHKATVRDWFKHGLRKIDDRRPFLANGADLEVFLKNRQNKRKRKCQPDELFCCRCKLPQQAKDNKVILTELNQKIGRLSGLCSQCGTRINKNVSLSKISEIKKTFTVLKTHNKNLTELDSPNVNINLKEGFST